MLRANSESASLPTQRNAVSITDVEGAIWREVTGGEPVPDHWPEWLMGAALAVVDLYVPGTDRVTDRENTRSDRLMRAADELRLCLKVMTTAAEHSERSSPDPYGERPEIIADCRAALDAYDELRRTLWVEAHAATT